MILGVRRQLSFGVLCVYERVPVYVNQVTSVTLQMTHDTLLALLPLPRARFSTTGEILGGKD